jgi:hypothetical protein
MDSVFGRSGNIIAWPKDADIYDLRGAHLATINAGNVHGHRGQHLGVLTNGFFRNHRGGTMAFCEAPAGCRSVERVGWIRSS